MRDQSIWLFGPTQKQQEKQLHQQSSSQLTRLVEHHLNAWQCEFAVNEHWCNQAAEGRPELGVSTAEQGLRYTERLLKRINLCVGRIKADCRWRTCRCGQEASSVGSSSSGSNSLLSLGGRVRNML